MQQICRSLKAFLIQAMIQQVLQLIMIKQSLQLTMIKQILQLTMIKQIRKFLKGYENYQSLGNCV